MAADSRYIRELIQHPRESLSVELKGWLDPGQPSDLAKIVKACIALRNHGGGFMLIGFDDRTSAPLLASAPAEPRRLFHVDVIQACVVKYASEPFEVHVHFGEREGHEFPVIEVESGVRTPISTKARLDDSSGQQALRENQVYVRSLRANNTPSTTLATWKDWGPLMDTCFENREADIGRFLRRHLGGLSADTIRQLAEAFSEANEPGPEQRALEFLEEGAHRFAELFGEIRANIQDHGYFDVALLLDGTVPPHEADREFLNLLASSNPNLTGWPIWLDSREFGLESERPRVYNGAWEAFVLSTGAVWSNHLDFWRLDPKGCFFLRRALQDDFTGRPENPQPLTCLDFGLAVLRTAEAIAVGVEFGKALGCEPDETRLLFAFRWTRLQGRTLSSWAQPGRYISPGRQSYQDEVVSTVVPFPLAVDTF